MSHSLSIDEIVTLPLTGLRYMLSDKLLKINSTDRFTPANAEQVDGLIEALEAAELNINQLFNIKFKTEDLLQSILEGKHVADRIWDLIIALKMVVADKKIPEELSHNIERLIRDWQGNIFPAAEMTLMMKELLDLSRDKEIERELDNAQKAILTGLAPRDINLNTPEKQLVWGSHILFLIYNPYMMQAWPESRRKSGYDLVKTNLWKQLLDCHQVKYLKAIFGSHIYNLLRRTDILVGWGPPGSWFYYSVNPAPGKINCDLLYSLLVGFDHARACTAHEIGHAVITKGIPDYIQELSDVIQDIEANDSALAATQELQLKQYFLNACEDNCVNRFTAEMGKVLGQDYAFSLNYWYTAIGDIGRRYVRKEVVYDQDTPQNRFKNLTFIISRAFCAHNGLFEDSIEGWESLMARPDWVEGRDRNNPEVQLPQHEALAQLRQMCEEVEFYFPDLQEFAGGPEYYAELADVYAKKRFELIHEIWKLYAEELVEKITEQEPEDLDDSMDRFQMEMNHTPPPPPKEKPKDQDKDEDKKDEKDKEDNPNPPSQSDKDSKKKMDEESNESPPDDQPPPEDDSGGGSGEDESAGDSADTPPEDSNDAGDDGESEDDDSDQGSAPEDGGSGAASDPGEKPEKKDQEEKEKPDAPEEDQKPKEVEGEGEPPEGADIQDDPTKEKEDADQKDSPEQQETATEEEPPTQMDPEELEKLMEQLMDKFKDLVDLKEDENSEEQVVEDEENPEAELIREEEDDSLPPEQKPEEENKDEKSGDRGDAQGGDADSTGVLDREFQPEEAASIEELLEALKEAEEQDKANDEARRKPMEREEEPEKETLKFDIPPAMNLDQLAKGNWEDFSRRIALHGPVIAIMASALKKLKKAQLKLINKVGKKHQLIPPGGDLRRFDQKKMQALLERLSKNEKFDTEHLSMFRKDDRRAAETRPTRIILIDGSRSMTFGAQPLPMDKAIQEAVIDYMASRVAGYDTYIAMFGPTNPIMLAEPGDSPFEIGKRIEKVHGGLNTMTYLAPALLQVIAKVAYRKKFEENYVGFTNFVIYTDGDIDDLKASRELIEQIFQHAPKTTFDFVLITEKHATPMDVLIRTIEKKNPLHEIGMVRSTAKRALPLAFTATMKLTNRLSKTKSGYADPAFLRTGQFRRLLHHLTR